MITIEEKNCALYTGICCFTTTLFLCTVNNPAVYLCSYCTFAVGFGSCIRWSNLSKKENKKNNSNLDEEDNIAMVNIVSIVDDNSDNSDHNNIPRATIVQPNIENSK